MLDQGIIEQAKQVLFGGAVIDAKGLVDLIFGHPEVSLVAGITSATVAITGVVKLYKLLKGQKPKQDSVRIEDNSVTIIQDIHVEAKTAQLYMNDAIRERIDRVVRPLAKEGIDTLEVRKGKELIERIQKSEVPERVYESSREGRTAEVLSDTREALLKVIKVNFAEKKGRWTFSDGTAQFGADVNDAAFQWKLDNREIGFYKGDVLRVMLKTIQTAQPSGTFKTKYSIEQVLEHRPLPTQRQLEHPGPQSEPTGTEKDEKSS
jgi:hypothetical protein